MAVAGKRFLNQRLPLLLGLPTPGLAIPGDLGVELGESRGWGISETVIGENDYN